MADSLQNVEFKSNGGTAHGYLVRPESGSGPGLIVVQEWWGLTTHIADITERFARAGFVALAPDLYGGPTTHDAAEAEQLMNAMPVDRAARDLAGAVDYLLELDGVEGDAIGVVGFCMGGGFALMLGSQQGDRIGAVAALYGLPPTELDYSGLTAAVQGHFGQQDAFIPTSAVESVLATVGEATGTEPELFWYPAGHAFINNENLLGTYDEAQATIAWDRVVDFLRGHLAV
jgi:carboxymethylenebutenolidase